MLPYIGFTFVNPLLVRLLVRHIEGVAPLPPPVAFGAACAMFVCAEGSSLTMAQFWWHGDRLGVRLKQSIAHLVFGKGLRLAPSAKQRIGIGAIVSFLQIDTVKIANACEFIRTPSRGPNPS